MMNIPDFTGMDPEEVKGILNTIYPNVEYDFTSYFSPKDNRDRSTSAVAYYVVRQRIVGNNRLEFTISPFLTNE